MRPVRPALARELALVGVALALAALVAPLAHARKKRPRQEPTRLALTLQVTPLAGFAPLDVRAAILVHDPQRVLLCPQFALVWSLKGAEPDGVSAFPGDVPCSGATGPLLHAPRARPLRLNRPGEWVIVASLADHGVALVDEKAVEVLGRTE